MLVDHEIEKLCLAGMVEPYVSSRLNPHSMDICIGDELLQEAPPGKDETAIFPGHTVVPSYLLNGDKRLWLKKSLTYCSPKHAFWLHPGDFVLVNTLEHFNIPETIAAQFVLKSSRARDGYGHLLAGFVDAGYHGRLTLELVNHNKHTLIPLWQGMPIGQLYFTRLRHQPLKGYKKTGRYGGDTGVQAAKS